MRVKVDTVTLKRNWATYRKIHDALPYNQMILFPGVCWREKTSHVLREVDTAMFIACCCVSNNLEATYMPIKRRMDK